MNQPVTKQKPWPWRIVQYLFATLAVFGIIGTLVYVVPKLSESTGAKSEVAAALKISTQPVRVTPALQQTIQAWVFAEGTARSVKRQYLTFDRAGRVTFVKRSRDGGDLRAGEPVRAGELLARLDRRQYESEIESTLASVAEAKAQVAVGKTEIQQADTQYELAAAKFRRIQQLLREKATSRSDYEEADANLKNAAVAKTAAVVKSQALEASVTAAEARVEQDRLALEETEIISPIDGIIAYLNIEEGFYFTQSNIRTTSESEALQTLPIVVIDPSIYEITVDVPAYQADQLDVGQQVLLVAGGVSATSAFNTIDTDSGKESRGTTTSGPAKGTVFSINPAVNPGGRSVQLKIRTTQGAEKLKDGMFVACWIEVQRKSNAIAAPFDAFLFEENRPYVFVVDPSAESPHGLGTARRVNVNIGIESLAAREILDGVHPGELLVTDGRYRLVDKAPVRMVNETQNASSPPMAAKALLP